MILCQLIDAFRVFDLFMQFSDMWGQLLAAVSKRNYFRQFIDDPNALMERLMTGRHLDFVEYGSTLASKEFLKEYETADQKPEFYQQVRSRSILKRGCCDISSAVGSSCC